MPQDAIPIHWTEDRERLAERLGAPPCLLVACDFDGTLAPLVPRPEDVALPDETQQVLQDLADSAAVRLAIISGRALADLVTRVPLRVDCLAGNHGLEMAGHGLDGVRAQADQLQPRLAGIAHSLAHALIDVEGVLVENKGLSLSVHYRRVHPPQWPMVIDAVHAQIAGDETLRLQSGHHVAEILPAIPWDKGEALKQIARRLGIPHRAIVYVGDDTTDEAAFLAIPTGTSISVGEHRPSQAHWMARGPDDVRALLAWVGSLRS